MFILSLVDPIQSHHSDTILACFLNLHLQHYLSADFKAYMSNCLLDTPMWITNRLFKFNVVAAQLFIPQPP